VGDSDALAAWLNYAQGSEQFNVTFSIGGGEKDLVASVLARRSGLICWEHDNIMPNIVGAIHSRVPISNYAAIPNRFQRFLSGLGAGPEGQALHVDFRQPEPDGRDV